MGLLTQEPAAILFRGNMVVKVSTERVTDVVPDACASLSAFDLLKPKFPIVVRAFEELRALLLSMTGWFTLCSLALAATT